MFVAFSYYHFHSTFINTCQFIVISNSSERLSIYSLFLCSPLCLLFAGSLASALKS